MQSNDKYLLYQNKKSRIEPGLLFIDYLLEQTSLILFAFQQCHSLSPR